MFVLVLGAVICAQQGDVSGYASQLLQRGHLHWFLASALFHAAAYQLLMDGSLADFGFGFVQGTGGAAGEIPLLTEVRIVLVAEAFQLVHFYFDSFVWKVSDRRVQSAL